MRLADMARLMRWEFQMVGWHTWSRMASCLQTFRKIRFFLKIFIDVQSSATRLENKKPEAKIRLFVLPGDCTRVFYNSDMHTKCQFMISGVIWFRARATATLPISHTKNESTNQRRRKEWLGPWTQRWCSDKVARSLPALHLNFNFFIDHTDPAGDGASD